MLSTLAGGTRLDVAVGETLFHLAPRYGSLRGVAWRLVLAVVTGLLGFGPCDGLAG